MAAKGWSLHIGLNSVDPNHYQGWSGELNACEADADDMERIAKQVGYARTQKLLTKDGTRANVLSAIAEAASALASGDLFFMSYSGHGGHIPDRNGDEPDHEDETWCLFNSELIDDELHTALKGFKEGVRVLVLSDSCHSGTVTRMVRRGESATILEVEPVGRPRAMPRSVALRTYQANREMYDKNQAAADANAIDSLRASVRLISGCQDAQTSSDGTFNGLFTATLLSVWNGGNFKQNYLKFVKAIRLQMPSDQQPNHFVIGARDTAFDKQRPFMIG